MRADRRNPATISDDPYRIAPEIRHGPATRIVNSQLKLPSPPSVDTVYDVMLLNPIGTFVVLAGNAAPTRNPNATPARTTTIAVTRSRLARPLLSDTARSFRREVGRPLARKGDRLPGSPPIGNLEDS